MEPLQLQRILWRKVAKNPHLILPELIEYEARKYAIDQIKVDDIAMKSMHVIKMQEYKSCGKNYYMLFVSWHIIRCKRMRYFLLDIELQATNVCTVYYIKCNNIYRSFYRSREHGNEKWEGVTYFKDDPESHLTLCVEEKKDGSFFTSSDTFISSHEDLNVLVAKRLNITPELRLYVKRKEEREAVILRKVIIK